MNALLTVISIAARIVSRSEGYAFACLRAHLPVGTRHRQYTLRSPGFFGANSRLSNAGHSALRTLVAAPSTPVSLR